jgi:lipopolysaccharide/colanic/teichoic acid biosynthesis glycosyltransferase
MNTEKWEIERKSPIFLDRESVLRRAENRRFFRRGQDILIALLGLGLLWPVMLAAAALLWLEEPHASPIFAQTRVGRDGREFTMYKFRSMHPGAEAGLDALLCRNETDGPAFKIRRDPRITRVGRFLRRSSIDELPQLFNVLRGDMSIVGPRPGLPREVAQYDDYARQRLLVLPGMTCYWQIQDNRDDIPFDDWIALDIQYIRDQNFLLDMKLILLTVKAMFSNQGS